MSDLLQYEVVQLVVALGGLAICFALAFGIFVTGVVLAERLSRRWF